MFRKGNTRIGSIVKVQEKAVVVPEKDVNFYDYDGTITNSYTKTEFLALSSLPANPSHSGLTAQGWNWTLSDAQTYVTTYGKLNIGQMYITDDGKTRIYITLGNGRLSPYLGLGVNGSVDVDWGDGTTHDTLTGTSLTTLVSVQHNYASAGDYVIKLTVNSGSFSIYSSGETISELLYKDRRQPLNPNWVYNNCITKVEIGNSITSIIQGFNHCYSLSSITIPNTITNISGSTFSACNSLQLVTIPSLVTSIGSSTFYSCDSLQLVTIPSSITSIGSNAFQYCHSLQSVTIPSSITSISDYAFAGCYSLQSVTIPSSITSIGIYAFQYCHSLQSVTIPSNVTSISSDAFRYCYSLQSVTIPSNVTSISSAAFHNCYSLQSVTIPSSITSISDYAFAACYSLQSVTIPSSITSISAYAFNGCYGLGYIKFESTTPPTVNASSAFSSISTDNIIFVPKGTLTTYTSTTNYPTTAQMDYGVFGDYTTGTTLPTTEDTYTLTWYGSIEDAVNRINAITVADSDKTYYAIATDPNVVTVTITNSGNSSRNYVKFPDSTGTSYYSATTFRALKNTILYCYMTAGSTTYTKKVIVDGVEVFSDTANPSTYSYTITSDISVTFTGTSSSSNKVITITTA